MGAYFLERVLLPNLALLDRESQEADRVVVDYVRLAQVLHRILSRRRSTLLPKRASVFTTNVDLVFELAFEEAGVSLTDGFSGRFVPIYDAGSFGTRLERVSARYERRSEVPTMDLIKLHGSVGWFFDHERILFDPTLSLIKDLRSMLEAAKSELIDLSTGPLPSVEELLEQAGESTLSASAKRFADAYSELAIVRPEKTKFEATVLGQTYYELLRRFANELERENSLLLVHGFSFRDEHIRDLTIRAAKTNPTLQVLVFCYSRESEIAIRTQLPHSSIPNDNIRLLSGDGLDLREFLNSWLEPVAPGPGGEPSAR